MSDTSTPIENDIGPYAMVPLWLIESGVSASALRVWALMAAKYAHRANHTCWPSQQRLADDLRLHRNTVHAAIEELRDAGALRCVNRRDEKGQTSNLYTLVFLMPGAMRRASAEPTPPPIHSTPPIQSTVPPPYSTQYPPPPVDCARTKGTELKVLNQRESSARETISFTAAHKATLVESPIAWHKRHGSHVNEFCDWVCFPQELASQFANRASLTDTEILTWAQSVRQTWQQAKKVPTGSMYDFWNARWAERQNVTTTDADSFAERHRRRREREAEDEQKKQEAYRKWQARVRAEMAEMARLREEIEREQQQSGE